MNQNQKDAARRLLFQNIPLLFVSLIAGLLLAELLIRFFNPQQLIVARPDIWCSDSILGWKHCPNVETKINTGEGLVTFKTDAYGHRVDSGDVNEKSDISFIVIGDSFASEMAVEAKDSAPERIADLLNSSLSKSVRAVNAGVSAWNPNQYYIAAKEELSKYSAYDAAVIFVYVGNDVVSKMLDVIPSRISERYSFRLPKKLSYSEIVKSVLYPINNYLEENSHLFVLLKNRLDILLMKLGLNNYIIEDVFKRSMEDSDSWSLTAEVFKNINREFGKHNIPTVFVLIPADYQVDQKIFYRMLSAFSIPKDTVDIDQPNRRLLEEMKKKGLNVVDLLETFRELHDSGVSLYFGIDKHLNPAGYNELAKAVVPKIRDIIYERR